MASAYDFVGALMLEQLPGAIRQLDALLSVDTGPAHLAALLFDKPPPTGFHPLWAHGPWCGSHSLVARLES